MCHCDHIRNEELIKLRAEVRWLNSQIYGPTGVTWMKTALERLEVIKTLKLELARRGVILSATSAAVTCPHNVNSETDRCVLCGKNRFQRDADTGTTVPSDAPGSRMHKTHDESVARLRVPQSDALLGRARKLHATGWVTVLALAAEFRAIAEEIAEFIWKKGEQPPSLDELKAVYEKRGDFDDPALEHAMLSAHYAIAQEIRAKYAATEGK